MSVCVLYIFPVPTSKKPGNRDVYNQWFSATSSHILPTTSDGTSSSTDMRHPQNIQTSYSKLKPEHGLSFCSLIGSQKEAWAVEAAWSRLPEVKATSWGRHEPDRALSHVNRWQCVAFLSTSRGELTVAELECICLLFSTPHKSGNPFRAGSCYLGRFVRSSHSRKILFQILGNNEYILEIQLFRPASRMGRQQWYHGHRCKLILNRAQG